MAAPPGPRPPVMPVGPVVSRLESLTDMLLGRARPGGKVMLSRYELAAVSSLFRAKADLTPGGGIIPPGRPNPNPR